MKKLLVVAAAVLSMPVAALADSWDHVSLVDRMCQNKVKSDPDGHPTSCLLKCAGSGYGILAPDGTWLALDDAGNAKALAALKQTKQKDHVRVDVTGERKGDVVQVASLKIAQ